MRSWRLQEARDRFKDLFDHAHAEGPQRVTRHGKQAVVVVSEEEWERLTSNVPSFGRLLAACPLQGADLPPRRKSRIVRAGTFD
jgi:prevent-host-death family protein